MCPEVAFQLLTKMDNSNEVVGVAVRWHSRRKGGRSKAEAAAAVVARVGCVVVEVVAVESAEDGSSSSNAAGAVSAHSKCQTVVQRVTPLPERPAQVTFQSIGHNFSWVIHEALQWQRAGSPCQGLYASSGQR